jgi:hypothetical protein
LKPQINHGSDALIVDVPCAQPERRAVHRVDKEQEKALKALERILDTDLVEMLHGTGTVAVS